MFDLAKLPIRCVESHSYLTAVPADQMRRHLSYINTTFNSWRVFWQCWKNYLKKNRTEEIELTPTPSNTTTTTQSTAKQCAYLYITYILEHNESYLAYFCLCLSHIVWRQWLLLGRTSALKHAACSTAISGAELHTIPALIQYTVWCISRLYDSSFKYNRWSAHFVHCLFGHITLSWQIPGNNLSACFYVRIIRTTNYLISIRIHFPLPAYNNKNNALNSMCTHNCL